MPNNRLTGTLLAFLLGLCMPAKAAETLVFAHLFPEDSPHQQVLLQAKAELAAQSHGELTLQILPRGLVGDQDTRIIEAISVGKADMTFAGGSFAARDYAPMGVISAPYNFRDFDHWLHFRDSPMAADLAQEYEKASGLTVLGYVYYGVRHVSAKVAIRTPQDMAGLKIRAPNTPTYLQLFRAFGANPVALPFVDIYDALKSGKVDAEENPLGIIEAFKFHKVAPYIALTGHITDTTVTVISRSRLHRLTPDQQQIVREVFARASNRLTELQREAELTALSRLKAEGATVITVDRAPFIAAAQPLLKGDAFAWSGELYDRLQKIP